MKRLLTLILVMAMLTVPVVPALASTGAPQDLKPRMERTENALLQLERQSKTGLLSPWSYIALLGAGNSTAAASALRACDLLYNDEQLQAGDTNSYALLILALVAAGIDPSSFHDQNLVARLQQAQLPDGKFADNLAGSGEDMENAHIWSSLALTATGTQIPDREKALAWLIGMQHQDGSFAWDAADTKTSDPDSTGMALMAMGALGATGSDPGVQKAIAFLRQAQLEDGGFQSWGAANSESCSAVIEGLLAVGIDPFGDQFSKTQGNPVTALLDFQRADGSFEHIKGGGTNEMATNQALMALSDLTAGRILPLRLAEKSGGAGQTLITFTVGSQNYSVVRSGKEESAKMDLAPFVDNGRTYLPVRFLASALGVRQQDIVWDEARGSVSLTMSGTVLQLTIGSQALLVNGAAGKAMDASPVIVQGRVCLPARFVAEAFGYRVNWDQQRPNDVIITG